MRKCLILECGILDTSTLGLRNIHIAKHQFRGQLDRRTWEDWSWSCSVVDCNQWLPIACTLLRYMLSVCMLIVHVGTSPCREIETVLTLYHIAGSSIRNTAKSRLFNSSSVAQAKLDILYLKTASRSFYPKFYRSAASYRSRKYW